MKVCKTIFIVLFLSLNSVFAGPSVIGNGGNGVFINDKLYVLDLVEASSHESPYFRDNSLKFYYQRVKNALAIFNDQNIVDLVSRKVTEVAGLDLIYTEALLKGFESVRWTLVDYRLVLIPVVSPVALMQHQIALRTNDMILIDRYYWNQLTPEHRAALLLHEINFILIRPTPTDNDTDLQKSAFQSRHLTGYMFSASMPAERPATFIRRLEPLFPSQHMLINNETIFAIYKTNTMSIFGEQESLTTNPFLEVNYMNRKENLSLRLMTEEKLKIALCQKKEIPQYIQLNTHAMNLELYKGDNNRQDYLSFIPSIDLNFDLTYPQKTTCNEQVTDLFKRLKRHITLYGGVN